MVKRLWLKNYDGFKVCDGRHFTIQICLFFGRYPGTLNSWMLKKLGFDPSPHGDPQNQELAAKSGGAAVVTRHTLGRFRQGVEGSGRC